MNDFGLSKEESKLIDYLKNNNGVIDEIYIVEDFDPIGESIISSLYQKGIVERSTSGDKTIVFLAESEKLKEWGIVD